MHTKRVCRNCGEEIERHERLTASLCKPCEKTLYSDLEGQ